MSDVLTPETRPVSPQFVLETFRDWYRLSRSWEEADPDFFPDFESTIAEWRDAFDLLGWKALARECNQYWEVDCPQEEWKSALEPASQRTIRDVCELIARHVRVSVVPPMEIFGVSCPAGGAFLAVRSMLAEAGANAEEISPSTLLDEYSREYGQVFLERVRRQWPGALPELKLSFDRGCGDFLMLGASAVGTILIGVGLLLGWLNLLDGMSLKLALSLIGVGLIPWVVYHFLKEWLNPPPQVILGDLQTFKDLARRLAAHSLQ